MKFSEKLKKLTEGRRRTEIAKTATVKPSVLNNYINRGSEPMAGAALRLSRALKVPLDWLVDDAADWPPPSSDKPVLSQMPDRDLMLELAERYRKGIVEVLGGLEHVEAENWTQIKSELEREWKEGEAMPPAAQRLVPMLQALDSATSAQLRYSLPFFAMANHQLLSGRERPVADFDGGKFDERFRRLNEDADFLHVLRRILFAVRPERVPSPKGIEFPDGTAWSSSQKPAAPVQGGAASDSPSTPASHPLGKITGPRKGEPVPPVPIFHIDRPPEAESETLPNKKRAFGAKNRLSSPNSRPKSSKSEIPASPKKSTQ